MPNRLFFELDKDKKDRIVNIGILEFATYGYTNSSTNRIVKDSDISKGSLFKYFQSKEELYFYLLDCVISEMIASLSLEINKLPRNLFDRVIKYSEIELAWYIQNPEKYKLIINALNKNNSDIYSKIEERYSLKEQDIYYQLADDIDEENLKWNKQKTIDILKWFLKGFNEEFISQADVQNNIDIESVRRDYVNKLTEYMEIIKGGLLL